MASQAPRPFRQGDLDGLCGAYAVVNATRLATLPHHRLRHAACAALFAELVDELAEAGRLRAFVTDGIGRGRLARLLRHAKLWLEVEYELRLKVSRPFRKDDEPGPGACLRLLAEHLARPAPRPSSARRTIGRLSAPSGAGGWCWPTATTGATSWPPARSATPPRRAGCTCQAPSCSGPRRRGHDRERLRRGGRARAAPPARAVRGDGRARRGRRARGPERAIDYLALRTRLGASLTLCEVDDLFSPWVSDRPGGFAEAELGLIRDLEPLAAFVFASALNVRVRPPRQ